MEKKSLMQEFKEFIMKGNVMDLAIGVIIGGAFTALVTAFTGNIVNPLLALIPGVNSLDNSLKIVLKEATVDAAGEPVEEVAIKFGAFIAAIITFLILALIVFLIVKAINKAREAGKQEEAPAAPTTKICPFCKSEIPLDAVRCPHCTSELPEE